jgi:hypothetical protein
MTEPRLFTQLRNGTPTATKDCAVETGRMAIFYGTAGRWVPSVAEFRRAARNPTSGLTSKQLMAAMRWARDEAAERGYPFELRIFRPAAPLAKLREALREGFFAGVAVKYATINEQFPEGSGQRTLNYRTVDGKKVPVYHELGLFGLDKVGDGNRTTVYDPLYDGRKRNWGQAPDRPVSAPFSVYREAMGEYAGNGMVIGFAVRPPQSEPEPIDLEEELRKARADLEAERLAHAETRAELTKYVDAMSVYMLDVKNLRLAIAKADAEFEQKHGGLT